MISRVNLARKFRPALIIVLLFLVFFISFFISKDVFQKRSVEASAAEQKRIALKNKKIELAAEKQKQKKKNKKGQFEGVDGDTLNIYNDGKKRAYLTFDDGPSPDVTPKILVILKKYNIKGTFFVVGSMAQYYGYVLKEEKADGHVIGNHTFSHNYKKLYSSVPNFMSDVQRCDSIIYNKIGNHTNLLRFPGGAYGEKFKPYEEAAKKAGYTYYNWDIYTGDADGNEIPVSKLVGTFKEYYKGQKRLVILMHDLETKETTVEALPQIIDFLKQQGYQFDTLLHDQ